MAFNLLFPDGRQQGNMAYRAETESGRKCHPQARDWCGEQSVNYLQKLHSHTSALPALGGGCPPHHTHTQPSTAGNQLWSQPQSEMQVQVQALVPTAWAMVDDWLNVADACVPPSTMEHLWWEKPAQGIYKVYTPARLSASHISSCDLCIQSSLEEE